MMLKKLIDEAIYADADAIKFQKKLSMVQTLNSTANSPKSRHVAKSFLLVTYMEI